MDNRRHIRKKDFELMYKLGHLESNGQSQDASQCNNRDVFVGHNVNNSSCNLSSPPAETPPKSSTTSVLRRWRRPESHDSKNAQSKELPAIQTSTDKQMNQVGNYTSGETATTSDFSLYVPQLSPVVPQSTARPYDSKFLPQYGENKDKTQNYYLENNNQEVHFRSPSYPVQNTPPLAHTSSQKYAYPNRDYSVVAHNYSPQKINPMESKISPQEDSNYCLAKSGYDNRISPQNMTQSYPIQNTIDRRVSPHNPKSPIYRNFPQNVQQNYAPPKSSEFQNNFYLDKPPCNQKQVIDARYQNYNQNYIKNAVQDPKLRDYRSVVSNPKKSSPPFPILEQRLNQSEASYCAEYPGQGYYNAKYGPVMFSRASPTPKIPGHNYPNIHHNPKIPQEMMVPSSYPFANKYYPQNQNQEWKIPKEYEQNLYLSQMNQMHARLQHTKPDLPRDLSYVDQNQRLVQKPRMYCSDSSPVEHLQYPGKPVVPVTQKSPKIVGYTPENDYLNLSRSCAKPADYQRSSKVDYSPVIQSVKAAELGYDPKLSRDYLMHQQACSEQQNYVCSPPLMGPNSRNPPPYPVGYPRQQNIKINEMPPRNISPRRTFQENMPVVVYSPQHVGIPKSSPTQIYPSEYSNPQHYPGYYPREVYPGIKPGMPQYPVDQTRKYPNVHFNGNMPQQRFHFGYPEQYYQHKMPESAEKLNYYQGNMYRGYNQNLHDLQQNAARNFEEEYRKAAANYTDFEAARADRTVYSKKDSDIGKSLKEFLESWEDDEEIVANLPDLVLCNNILPDKQKLPFGHSEDTSETSKSSSDEEITKENEACCSAEQPLYILGSTNISSEALPQYLAVYEQVDRLPDNIKGFYKGPNTNEVEETQPVVKNNEKTEHLEVPPESNRASQSPHDLTINKNREEKTIDKEEEVLNLCTNRNKENNEFLVEEYSNHSENSTTETPKIDDSNNHEIKENAEHKKENIDEEITEDIKKKVGMIKDFIKEVKKNDCDETCQEDKCFLVIPLRKREKNEDQTDKTKNEPSVVENEIKTDSESKIQVTTSVIVPNTFFEINKTDNLSILNGDSIKKDSEIEILSKSNSVQEISDVTENAELNNNDDLLQEIETKETIDDKLDLDVIDFHTTDLIPRTNFETEISVEKEIDSIIEPMSFENLINSPENIEMKVDEFDTFTKTETIIETKNDILCSPSTENIVRAENDSTDVQNKEIFENTDKVDIIAETSEIIEKPEQDESKLIENISEVISEEHIELLNDTEEIVQQIEISENKNDVEIEISDTKNEKQSSESTNDTEILTTQTGESLIKPENEMSAQIDKENTSILEEKIETITMQNNETTIPEENIETSTMPVENIEMSTMSPSLTVENIETSLTMPLENVEISSTMSVKNVETSSIMPVENINSSTMTVENVETSTMSVENVETSSTMPVENIKSSIISVENVETSTMPVENIKSSIISVENVETSTMSVENVETSSTISVDNIETSTIPEENVETSTMENIGTSTIPEENIDTSSTISVENVKTSSTMSVENIGISTMSEKNIETSKMENIETLTMPEENIDTSTIPAENIEISTMPEENTEISTMPEENIETSIPEDNIETSTIPEDNIETSTIPEDNIETSTIPEDNIETSTITEDNIETSTIPEYNIDISTIPENNIETSTIPEDNTEISTVPVEKTETESDNQRNESSDVQDNEESLSENEVKKEDACFSHSILSPLSNYVIKEDSLEIESSPVDYSNEIEDIGITYTEETNIESTQNYTEENGEDTCESIVKEEIKEDIVVEEMEPVSEEMNILEEFPNEEVVQSESHFESTVDKLVIVNVETIQDDSNESTIENDADDSNIENNTSESLNKENEENSDIPEEENQEYAHLVGIEDQEDTCIKEEETNKNDTEYSEIKNTKNENNNFDFSYLESCTENICEKPESTSDASENNSQHSETQETYNNLKSLLDSSESESDIPKETENADKVIIPDKIEDEIQINSENICKNNEKVEELITEETVVSANITESIPEISQDAETTVNFEPEYEKEENVETEVYTEISVQTEEKQELLEPNIVPEPETTSSNSLTPENNHKTTEKQLEISGSNILASETEKQIVISDCQLQPENQSVLCDTIVDVENNSEIPESMVESDTVGSSNIVEENLTESVILTENISSEENIILSEDSECVVIYGEDEQYLIIQNETNEEDCSDEMVLQETEIIIPELTEPENEEIFVEEVLTDPLGEEIIICEEGIEDWVQNEEIVESNGKEEITELRTNKKEEKRSEKLLENKRNHVDLIKKKKQDIKTRDKLVKNKYKDKNKKIFPKERKYKKIWRSKKHQDIKQIIEKFITEEKKSSNSEEIPDISEERSNSVEEKELFINPENPVSLSNNPYPFPESTSALKRRVSYDSFSSPKIDFKAPKRRYSSLELGRVVKKPIINLDEISKNITEVLENFSKQETQYVAEKNEKKVEKIDKLQEIKEIQQEIEEEEKNTSKIIVNNSDIPSPEREEIIETEINLECINSSPKICISGNSSPDNVTKLVEQLIKPKLIIPKSNFNFVENSTIESNPEELPLIPKRRTSLLKIPEIQEDNSSIVNTARLTEPIFPKSSISEPKTTKKQNVDPRIERPKEELKDEKEKPTLIENKLSNTFRLTEYTKSYIKMKTGQTVDSKNICGLNGHKRIDSKINKESKTEDKCPKKDGSKNEKKVKINLQDYRNRKQSQSSDSISDLLSSPQSNDDKQVRKEKHGESKSKNKAERKLYQNDVKSVKDDIPDRKVEKLIIKPKKSLESSKDLLIPEVSSEETKSNPTNKLDCKNLDSSSKSKYLKHIRPKKRKRRFRNLYTIDEEEDVPTKQLRISLDANGLHNEDSTSSKMSEDSQSTGNSSKNEDSELSNSNGDLLCCLDLNSNGTTETNCSYKCHIKIDSEEKNIRDYEINKNSCSNSNKLKLTLKPVKKKKPAFDEVLSNLDSLVESEILSKRIKKRVNGNKRSDRNSDGTLWTIKNKVPKVIIKRNGSGYCAVFRDVSSNPIWQPKIRLKRQKYIESLVLRSKC